MENKVGMKPIFTRESQKKQREQSKAGTIVEEIWLGIFQNDEHKLAQATNMYYFTKTRSGIQK